jgi:hypothetical protein
MWKPMNFNSKKHTFLLKKGKKLLDFSISAFGKVAKSNWYFGPLFFEKRHIVGQNYMCGLSTQFNYSHTLLQWNRSTLSLQWMVPTVHNFNKRCLFVILKVTHTWTSTLNVIEALKYMLHYVFHPWISKSIFILLLLKLFYTSFTFEKSKLRIWKWCLNFKYNWFHKIRNIFIDFLTGKLIEYCFRIVWLMNLIHLW